MKFGKWTLKHDYHSSGDHRIIAEKPQTGKHNEITRKVGMWARYQGFATIQLEDETGTKKTIVAQTAFFDGEEYNEALGVKPGETEKTFMIMEKVFKV